MTEQILTHKPIVQKLIDLYTEESFDKFPDDFLTFCNNVSLENNDRLKSDIMSLEILKAETAFLRELIYTELRFYVEHDEHYAYNYSIDVPSHDKLNYVKYQISFNAIKTVVKELLNLGFEICIVALNRKYWCKKSDDECIDIGEIEHIGISKLTRNKIQTDSKNTSLIDSLIELYSQTTFEKFPNDIVDIFHNEKHQKMINGENLLRRTIYLYYKFYKNFSLTVDFNMSTSDADIKKVIQELLTFNFRLRIRYLYTLQYIDLTIKDDLNIMLETEGGVISLAISGFNSTYSNLINE